jgi:hypothetical protein
MRDHRIERPEPRQPKARGRQKFGEAQQSKRLFLRANERAR